MRRTLSTPPRNPLIFLTLLKPGTRPEGVGLSPRRGRRKLLIYGLEIPTSVIRGFRMHAIERLWSILS
ncbi:MAG: hypothetical protein ACERK9_11590, partial [Deltaproteobacteria bacterium]